MSWRRSGDHSSQDPAEPELSWRQRRIAYTAASRLLSYPDEALEAELATIHAAIGGLPGLLPGHFDRYFSLTSESSLLQRQAQYVSIFDMKRRCCLYLTYYLNGDTRKRGGALWRFQETYKIAGWRVDGGELPDFLPVLLEFAAAGADEESAALSLLDEHKQGLDVLRQALERFKAPHQHVVAAVLELLPELTPLQRAAAEMLVAQGPPAETVGLEPFTLTDVSIGARS